MAPSPSASSPGSRLDYDGAVIQSSLRLLVGPLALAGFFLPWAHGSGLLGGATFTGFSLLRFAGDLQSLQLSLAQGATLWVVRLLILAVPVAAAWQVLLAWRWRWHPAYRWSGAYVAAFALVALLAGLARSGPVVPPAGLWCLATSAACFAAANAGSFARPVNPQRMIR
jgi:hypothetical protein